MARVALALAGMMVAVLLSGCTIERVVLYETINNPTPTWTP